MTSAHVVRKLIGALQRNISQLDKNGVTDSVMRTEEYFARLIPRGVRCLRFTRCTSHEQNQMHKQLEICNFLQS